ncbi:MAG: glycosyltransferase [Deltaproteobacteria bacterium]|nr:glycosyltransferase [Deltaproteobacteria bacterium]
MIRAIGRLKEDGVPVHARIVGDGPLLETLKSFAIEIGLERSIDFPGRVPFSALPAEMADADIFCLPSVTDRYGGKDEISMVLKEAMGTCLPIVATIHAGIPEVIEDGVNGLLVPERDVDALADALGRLVREPSFRKIIGRGGRELVERVWDIERQVSVLESLYAELLGR